MVGRLYKRKKKKEKEKSRILKKINREESLFRQLVTKNRDFCGFSVGNFIFRQLVTSFADF